MKKFIICLFVLTFSLAGFAQKSFTAATFDGILTEYKKDSKAFFTNRLSSDFRYANPDGAFTNRESVIASVTQTIVATEILEPVIFQSGDLAVISGIHKTERIGKDGTNTKSKVACTYTFQWRQDKWMFVASQQTRIVEK